MNTKQWNAMPHNRTVSSRLQQTGFTDIKPTSRPASSRTFATHHVHSAPQWAHSQSSQLCRVFATTALLCLYTIKIQIQKNKIQTQYTNTVLSATWRKPVQSSRRVDRLTDCLSLTVVINIETCFPCSAPEQNNYNNTKTNYLIVQNLRKAF